MVGDPSVAAIAAWSVSVGFALTGFYEDIDPDRILGKYTPSYIASKATKPTW
jgi:hypothetical protein